MNVVIWSTAITFNVATMALRKKCKKKALNPSKPHESLIAAKPKCELPRIILQPGLNSELHFKAKLAARNPIAIASFKYNNNHLLSN